MTHVDNPPLLAGFARRTSVSPIARTLEIVDATPGMISFACGNPATEALQVEAIQAAATAALRDDTVRALQYVRPRGILQEALVDHLAEDGIEASAAELMPTTGAIQALALIAHALIEPGDAVVTERPTYPVNLATFKAHGARTIGVPMDSGGMRVDLLERLLVQLDPPPKAIYVIPDAQNPTGITMSLDRRHELVEVAGRHGVLLVEDVPYRGVHYEGEPSPTVYELARRAGVECVLVGSFAKTVAPGLRVGFLLARPALIDACVRLKTGEDFCTPGLNQLIIERLIRSGGVAESVAGMRRAQGPKRDAMLSALERELGNQPGVSWTRPVGGLFVWMSLSERVDTDALLERAIERRVAFIPGRYFYPEAGVTENGTLETTGTPKHELRLNFSDPALAEIPRGIATLAQLIRTAD